MDDLLRLIGEQAVRLSLMEREIVRLRALVPEDQAEPRDMPPFLAAMAGAS